MVSNNRKIFPGTEFISTVLQAADAKSSMTKHLSRVFLMRAAMAGVLIGIFYLANYSVISAFTEIGTNYAKVGSIAGAVTFGFCLVFIYYSKSELLTSNMMVTTIAVYFRRMSFGRAGAVLALCYLGNFLGGLAVAGMVWFTTLLDGPTGELVTASVDHKLAFISGGASGIADLFFRAILCNFMINIAMLLIYNGFVQSDGVRVAAMVVSVLLFAFLGFEHSVANTVLFTVEGLRNGIDIGLALGNIGVALVGNFVGGGLLIGLYYAYANDSERHRRTHPSLEDV
ncbi:formate/nitrite transporter family protein [Actinomyces minihominis]|uniref:formate/nitrite transporter family protein n=1 Tax=Actinomyces minihominis TaxID=2002838 RepID=UPI000C07FA45|nr:formate/nitrite transporter family protein [Actinomyces minihominis]